MNRGRGTKLRSRLLIALCAAVMTSMLVGAPQSLALQDGAQPAARSCKPGTPGLAATVGWRTQDENWLVMTPHVQVANCRGRIKYVRVLIESYNNGFLTERKTNAFGTYPSKYGNGNMMVHWPNYLPTVYEANQSGRYVGIGFADVFPDSAPADASRASIARINQRPYELTSCTRRVDGIEVDTSAVTFQVTVWPLDARRKIIRDIGSAILGPFTCLQPNVSTAQ